MLSVVIPTYNENRSIGKLLERIAAVREDIPGGLELLVVDDRSTDGTADLAERLLRQYGLGRVIRRTGPRDLAQSVMEGVRQAGGELIGVMDADFSHPPELLPELVRAVRTGAEAAVASRYVPGGRIGRWPWHRRWLSRIGNLMVQPLTGVADATSGYFVCHARLLRSLARPPRGFKILLELLVCGQVQRVREVPYTFTDRLRGSSKLGSRALWRYVTQVAWLYADRLRNAHV